MSEPTQLEQAILSAVDMQKSSWAALVDVAVRLPVDRIDSSLTELAKHMHQGKDSLKRKINAILYCRELGHSVEEIKGYGQEPVLSRYIKKTNADRYEQTTVMKWNIPGSLREVIRQDMAAVAEILKIETSEKLWDFLHSVLHDLTQNPDSLKQLAGELQPKGGKFVKTSSPTTR